MIDDIALEDQTTPGDIAFAREMGEALHNSFNGDNCEPGMERFGFVLTAFEIGGHPDAFLDITDLPPVQALEALTAALERLKARMLTLSAEGRPQ